MHSAVGIPPRSFTSSHVLQANSGGKGTIQAQRGAEATGGDEG